MEQPISETELLYWIWLQKAISPGSRLAEKLLSRFEYRIADVFHAEREAYQQIEGLDPQVLQALLQKDLSYAMETLAYCRNEKITVLTPDTDGYPDSLRFIQAPPLVLYVRGTMPDLKNRFSVSVVGTRNMTEYGSHNAYLMAHDLARAGTVIVSGMAKGIDGIAHRGCLDAGGDTVAVLGCGVNRCYPQEHESLMNEILRHGAVISEFPPFTPPIGKHFPIRNRIISGLSQATLVIEAHETSGALITARDAIMQGRPLFALPGKVGEKNSLGVNTLLGEGAAIATCAMDILRQFRARYPKTLNISAVPQPGIASKNIQSPISRRSRVGERAYAPADVRIDRFSDPANIPIQKPDSAAVSSLRVPISNRTENDTSENERAIGLPRMKESEEERAKKPSVPLNETEERLLSQMPPDTIVTADELSEKGFSIQEVLITLTTLEIKGLVESRPGNAYIRI